MDWNCKKCNGSTWILSDGNTVKECDCRKKYIYQVTLKKSGAGENFARNNFKNYKAETEQQRTIKDRAMKYADEFKNDSVLLLGQIGSGKTHLANAISLVLLDKGIGVEVMRYRDSMAKLKQIVLDAQAYGEAMDSYKNADVLFIDDLFKGKVTEAEVNYMFEIIDARYEQGNPVIVTSEKTPKELIAVDEAIVSRIVQMSNGNVFNMTGIKNYRLGGIITKISA